MQIRYRTLTLVITMALTGCNTLDRKQDQDTSLRQTASHPVVSEVPAATANPLVASDNQSAAPAAVHTPVARQVAELAPPPAASTDLLERLRDGFRLEIPDNPRIESQIDWYTANADYLGRVQKRAAPYLHFIVEEAEKRNMPTELALLPVIESGFQPFAYSPGRAAGLWQFIPSTGEHFGLQQNWWYDGRRDVVSATHAALDYLSDLAEQFDGDWELALAGYNAGPGTIRRAIKRNQKRGKPTDFWSLSLPRETMGYVPRLLAVARVIAAPEAYGINLSPIPNRPYFEIVDIGSQIDLALAADLADISIEEMYKLNPGFNRWATAPEGPHRLSIPIGKAERFSQALTDLESEQRLSWNRYRIQPGDNLGSIARQHKTTVKLLQQINKLRGHNIRAGKHLLIPVATRQLDQYTYTADARKAKTQNQQRRGTRLAYEVRAGDTLWDIAREHKVSHQALARWNGMSPRDTLRLGQTLVIWQPETSQGKSAASIHPGKALPFATRSKLRYRVRQGDSLYLIAQRFNVSVSDLRKWNTLDERYLQPGQRLELFVEVTEQTL